MMRFKLRDLLIIAISLVTDFEKISTMRVDMNHLAILEPAPQGLVCAEVVKQSHLSLCIIKNASYLAPISDWRVLTLSEPCARPQ